MNRYFLALFVALGLIVLLIIIFAGGGGKNLHKAMPVAPLVAMASSDSEVKMTISGPVVAEQDHRSIEIKITKDRVVYNSIQGYNNNVVFSQNFINNLNSYTAFLSSLNQAGYTNVNTDPKLENDLGYCSIGNRYIFQTTQAGKNISRSWVTNCTGTPRTFLGSLSLTSTLFEAQIPNFGRINTTSNLF
jgi:hypothetical protein